MNFTTHAVMAIMDTKNKGTGKLNPELNPEWRSIDHLVRLIYDDPGAIIWGEGRSYVHM